MTRPWNASRSAWTANPRTTSHKLRVNALTFSEFASCP